MEELEVRYKKVDLLNKKIDSYAKQSDVLYKKAFVILAILGGLGTMYMKLDLINALDYIIVSIFVFMTVGLFAIYLKLSRINKKIDKILTDIERINHE